MRYELWGAILAARGDVDRLVASAATDYPNQASPRPVPVRRPPPRPPSGPQLVRAAGGAAVAAAPQPMATAQDTARLWADPAQPAEAPGASVEHDALRRLHDAVRARIETLRTQLATEPGVEQAMLALVLYFDEHIMGKLLPRFFATSWPLLQTRYTNRTTGGSDFFRILDGLREAEGQPRFVFEVYYFCLASGFRGRYAAEPAALEGYMQWLRVRIAAQEPARQPPPPVARPSRAPIRLPALYYVVALAVVVAFAWVLTVWSNQ